MRIALDFDGVLWDPATQDWLPGGSWFLRSLIRDRHQVTIFSCRASWPEGRQTIRTALNGKGFRNVPIWEGLKPNADCYIDDRALRFTGVEETRASLRALAREQR